jgi:hypothetical protein
LQIDSLIRAAAIECSTRQPAQNQQVTRIEPFGVFQLPKRRGAITGLHPVIGAADMRLGEIRVEYERPFGSITLLFQRGFARQPEGSKLSGLMKGNVVDTRKPSPCTRNTRL